MLCRTGIDAGQSSLLQDGNNALFPKDNQMSVKDASLELSAAIGRLESQLKSQLARFASELETVRRERDSLAQAGAAASASLFAPDSESADDASALQAQVEALEAQVKGLKADRDALAADNRQLAATLAHAIETVDQLIAQLPEAD